ncbi:hypothetical protein B0H14DRAFT_3144066 [Mycena olivaceomarginata]|nr:hypothetical protein B0H14DRAFT_3144066 [Mycena olivaceomarginata]
MLEMQRFTAFRPLIGRGCRALPPSATLGLPYATGSAEKRLPRAAAIGRGGGGQPLPPQLTCSSDHGAVVAYGVIDFEARADPGVVIAGLVAGISIRATAFGSMDPSQDSSRGGYYTPAEPGFLLWEWRTSWRPISPVPTVWQRPELVGRNQASRLVGIGPLPGRTNINQCSASLNDPSTPTPARYYSQRLPPIAELSQMDRLLDDNTEIKQRLGVLETGGISPSTPAPVNRGIAAQRGGRITQAKTRGQRHRVTVVGGGGSENNIAIDPALDASSASDFANDTDYPSDNDNPSDTATDYRSDASTDHPSDACDSAGPIALNSLDLLDVELHLLQVNQQSLVCNSFVTNVFRRVCDVSRSHWLDPLSVRTNELTEEVYPSPFFEFGITYTRNTSLCIQVVKQAMKDLKDRDAWPSGLKREPTEPEPWDLPLLNELAKESFRNLKKSWRTQTNPNAAVKAKIGRQSECQNKRRKAKAKNICKIVDTFGTARRLQPDFLRDISHEQYLSEEVSGPDENSGESHEAWKVRKTKFLEVLSPAWRTPEVGFRSFWPHPDSRISIRNLFMTSRNFGSAERNENNLQKYVRVSLGRLSHRIPVYAPYNFGISDDWLVEKRRKPENEQLLDDWGTHVEPDDCGLVLTTSNAGDN